MRNWVWIVLLLGLMALASAHSADEPQKPTGVYSSLKVGQHVTLKNEGTAFTISYFDEETPLAHKVVEVGTDFIVLQDAAGVAETTIPIYAVTAVVKVRTKRK